MLDKNIEKLSADEGTDKVAENTKNKNKKKDSVEEKEVVDDNVTKVSLEEKEVVDEDVIKDSVEEKEVVDEEVIKDSIEDKEIVDENKTKNSKDSVEEEEVVDDNITKDSVEEKEVVDDNVTKVSEEEKEVVDEDVIKDSVEEKEIVDENKTEDSVEEEEVVDDNVTKVSVEEKEVIDEDVVKESIEKKELVDEDVTNDGEGEKEIIDDKITDSKPVEQPVKIEEKANNEEKKLEIPVINVAKLTLDELVDNIQKLLDQFPIKDIKNQIEILKSDFLKKFKTLIAEKKVEFIKDGGNEIDFHFASPIKKRFNDLIFEYKKTRQQYYKDLEKEQKENLENRLKLIDELKDLIDNAEASTMYKNFKVLQDKWRIIGQIPHSKYNDVWRTYHHHVERFYDLLHLNNDFRDLDFKHNLEEKTRLAEKAEELAQEDDVNHAFKELQILHRLWKEDIGPVARDMREEIWSRFSEATKKIHHKRHEFQDKLDEKLNDNIELKLAVIEKIKAINVDNITSHKLWQDSIKNLELLRDEFFATGRVPKSKNEEIWQLFKDATRKFNKSKNSFYKNIKKDQSENLRKKILLVEQAESLKDSDDWNMSTEVYKKIQSDWKKIGHVPRKDSDKIWKRFKDACNHYFDRLHEKQDGTSKDQVEIFNKKKDFIEQFKEQMDQEDNLTIDLVNAYIKDWRELGRVPVKMRHIDTKFNKTLDVAYKKLNIDKKEAAFLKFKNIIDSYVEQNDVRKIDSEQLFVRRKVDEITKEIKQLENNISFISNASEDNPIVKNVFRNIENYKSDLDIWKKKITYMNKLDY